MSYITLNRSHFFHNLKLIEGHISSREKIAVVLKDNAYGHGLTEMASLAQEYGLLHAVVRTSLEAQQIREYFQTILVLADDLSTPPPPNAHIAINDVSLLQKLPKGSSIELKVDSGMHRSGLDPNELDDAFKLIQKHGLILKGIFTHHRSADVLSSEFFWQEKKFEQIKERSKVLLKEYEMTDIRFHSQNSAATFRTQKAGDIVRVGIAAYGLLEMPSSLLKSEFRPVLSLWANKLHSFKSKQQFKHGYEGKGRISEDKTVSTYDLGYADGVLRLDDETNYCMPQGASLIGRISMDNIIADSDKEELCIYNNANNYAKAASTISYEVTTRLAPQLKRIILS